MENFVSSWSDGTKLPENYVFPPGKRPGKLVVTTPKNIPVIDIGKAVGLDRSEIIQQVMQASQEFGFFQVINHGVVSTLLDDTRGVFEEFFALPADEKVNLCSSDKNKNCLLLTSNVAYDKEEFHNWRDTLRIKGSPLEAHKQEWPLKPVGFRDIVGDYTTELRNLALRILELICEGLGLEKNYFTKELSKEELLVVHQYPTCPDPSLTLGTRSHTDPGLIGIVLQGDIPGLQVMNDGEWIGVEVIPDAFVVNVGFVLEFVSNGKLPSVEHRVVTSKDQSRISSAYFLVPESNCVVEPAKALVNAENPPIYRSVQYSELFNMFMAAYIGEIDSVSGSCRI
ncbi:protein DOWNY MILDEW RESISTANCE 6-like [Silene latifolia]|uniref:protein DOWNY MILDEW RESISTANCE 6-like n=1 Tax=Silene latifolia TaxID=37657 RepID=UPI003D777A9C